MFFLSFLVANTKQNKAQLKINTAVMQQTRIVITIQICVNATVKNTHYYKIGTGQIILNSKEFG